MLNRVMDSYKKNKLRLMVLLVIAITLLVFGGRKEAYYLDEILSYQLSSAEFNPFVLPFQPVGRLAKFVNDEIRGESVGETWSNLMDTVADVVENKGNSKLVQYKADVYSEPVWISGEQMRDYFIVTEEDDFNYLSVYFNTRADIHPPLYYMALHTMSSIAKGSDSPMRGCVLNILLMLGTCVCLMKLCNLMEKHGMLPEGVGRYAGSCGAILYALSSGGIATMLFARMYGMMAFFFTLSFYLHMKKWLEGGFATKRLGLILVTVGGFLTQYFFLFFCIPLAAVTVVLLVAKKRYKELWNYCGSMIFAAALGVGLFPFCFSDVFSSAFGTEITAVLGSGFGDYGRRLFEFLCFWVERYFGNIIYGVVLLVAIVAGTIAVSLVKKWRPVMEKSEHKSVFWAMLIAGVAGYVLLTAKASVLIHARYLMPVYPFLALMLSFALYWIVLGIKKLPRYSPIVFAAVFAVVGFVTYDDEYIYEGYNRQVTLAQEYGELPCICVYLWDQFYENMVDLKEYEKVLLVTPDELLYRENPDELRELKEFVVIRKDSVSEESLLATAEEYGWILKKVLMTDKESALEDTIYLFEGTQK